jgi:TorA maturation chaperone TorD
MNTNLISPVTVNLFKFYTQCFAFPYEEMNYELQNLYRLLENEISSDDEVFMSDQVLSIINQYQGEDLVNLRMEYVAIFTAQESGTIICPIIASDFCRFASKSYDSTEAEEQIVDSGIPINPDEPIDSILNYLQYLSFACDEFIISDIDENILVSFYRTHIMYWVPLFCDLLYSSAGLAFYKELAVGLKETLLYYEQE